MYFPVFELFDIRGFERDEMNINSETELRHFLSRHTVTGSLFFIEPAPGSTHGLPDCFLCLGAGRVAYLELKLARDTDFRFKLRDSQSLVFGRFIKWNLPLFILVAAQGKPYIKIIDWALKEATETTADDVGFDHLMSFIRQRIRVNMIQ